MHTQAEQRAHEIEASCGLPTRFGQHSSSKIYGPAQCRPFIFGLLFGLFELALVLVRFDHLASIIVNAAAYQSGLSLNIKSVMPSGPGTILRLVAAPIRIRMPRCIG
jgi:hypothetical protein